MEKFKTQIRESFFNPILHIFPVLIFIITSYISNRTFGWLSAVLVAIVLAIYVRITYKSLFKWYMFYMLIFFVVSTIMSITSLLFRDTYLSGITDELIFFIALTVIFVLRKPMIRLSDKLVSSIIPMSNNINEFYKIIKIFILLVAGYLFLYIMFRIIDNYQVERFIRILNFVYIILVICVIIYEFLKVRIIRSQLANERWLPIITKDGKVVGTIQRISSLSDRRKYIHPVARGILINDSKILLQQATKTDIYYKPLWDTFVSNHVSIGETAEQSLSNTALENFNITDLKSFFLTKYLHETAFEIQYILVFIICKFTGEILPDTTRIEHLKWWTTQQIENNLNAGIFTEQFIKEYDLMKRAGLLESEEYDCKCDLPTDQDSVSPDEK